MAISDRTRKLLWGKSGNCCAICKKRLIIDANLNDKESIIGEECHIVSIRPEGPRHRINAIQKYIDSYDNLLLLCREHHKMIDDQYETYTEEILIQKKKEHELWVVNKLCEDKRKEKPLSIKRIKENIPKALLRISNGKEFFNLLKDTYGFYYDYDDMETEEELEIVKWFMQYTVDLLDVHENFEISDIIEVSSELNKEIAELESKGLYVFGARENQIIEGGIEGTGNWPIFHLRITRKENLSKIE